MCLLLLLLVLLVCVCVCWCAYVGRCSVCVCVGGWQLVFECSCVRSCVFCACLCAVSFTLMAYSLISDCLRVDRV